MGPFDGARSNDLFSGLFGGPTMPQVQYDPAKDPKGVKSGGGMDWASILAALPMLAGNNQPPPPPPMQFAPMPQPSAMSTLANAPRIGQQQMMPTPPMWQPYMWGNR